jgi:hypothetical protein
MPVTLVGLFEKQGASLQVPETSPFKHKSPDKTAASDMDTLTRWGQFKSRSREALDKDKEEIQAREAAEKVAVLEKRQGIKRHLDEAFGKGAMLGPDLKKQANYRNAGRKSQVGRKTGKAAGLKSNKRELGGPVLRRDPTASAKMNMVMDLIANCKVHGVQDPRELPSFVKRAWEARTRGRGKG